MFDYRQQKSKEKNFSDKETNKILFNSNVLTFKRMCGLIFAMQPIFDEK